MDSEVIGKYEVIAALGRGSMGVVYKARDPEIGRTVAIKTLRTIYLGNDPAGTEALQRFRQESRSAGRLRHPNIVTIYETGRTGDGSPYIVMEYIEGESLEQIIAQRSPIDPLECLHYLGQIGSAIDYAHSQSVIHRDIKPSNVIVDGALRPHLLDFGVAKLSDASLTPAGTVVGTPSYMSPEQIRGEVLDGAADRFAFAVMTFEMFSGKRPFPGADFTAVVTNIIHKAPLSFADLGVRHLPAELERVLQRGLAKERSDRYGSCLEFLDAAGKVLGVLVDGSGVPGYRKGARWTGAARGAAETGGSTLISAPVFPLELLEKRKGEETESHRAENDGTLEVRSSTPAVARSGSGLRSVVVLGLSLVLIGLGVITLLAPRGPHDSALKPTRAGGTPLHHSSASGTPAAKEKEAAEDEVTRADVMEIPAGAVSSPGPSVATPGLVEETASHSSVAEGGAASAGMSEKAEKALALMRDPSADTAQLVAAIGTTGAEEFAPATPDLIRLSSHPAYQVRIAVLKAFAASTVFRTKDVYRVVVERLSDDQFLVRGFAVKMLAALPSEAAVKILEERRKVEKNEVVLKVLNDALKNRQASESVEEGRQSSAGSSSLQ